MLAFMNNNIWRLLIFTGVCDALAYCGLNLIRDEFLFKDTNLTSIP